MKRAILYFEKTDPLILGLILSLIFFIAVFHSYLFGHLGNDTAEYLNNPFRVINGEKPYRDFWLLFPPGEVMFPAFIYKTFSLNINYVLIASVIVSFLTGLIFFATAANILKIKLYSFLATLLFFFDGVVILYGSYNVGYIYNNLFTLFILLSFLFYLFYIRQNNRAFLFLAGFSLGITSFFRLYEVIPLLIALIISSFFFPKTLFRKKIEEILIFLIGFFFWQLLVYINFSDIYLLMLKQIFVTSLTDVYYFTKPIIELRNIDMASINSIPLLLWRVFYFLIFLVRSLGHYSLVILLVILGTRGLFNQKLNIQEKTIILILLIWGGLSALRLLQSISSTALMFSFTPFFILAFLLIEKVGNKILLAVVLTLLASSLLIFARKFAHNLLTPTYSVNTPHGSFLLKNKQEAAEINSVLEFIEKNTKGGDHIFTIPSGLPPIYALTSRKNPTYFDSLHLGAEKKQNICERLLKKKVKVIIHDSPNIKKYDKAFPQLTQCIKEHFKIAAQYEYYRLYVSNNK